MNTAGLVASAFAIAGASFGAGRVTATASSTATASAAPAICDNNDALAAMLKKGEIARAESQARNLQKARDAQSIETTAIQASPVQ